MSPARSVSNGRGQGVVIFGVGTKGRLEGCDLAGNAWACLQIGGGAEPVVAACKCERGWGVSRLIIHEDSDLAGMPAYRRRRRSIRWWRCASASESSRGGQWGPVTPASIFV